MRSPRPCISCLFGVFWLGLERSIICERTFELAHTRVIWEMPAGRNSKSKCPAVLCISTDTRLSFIRALCYARANLERETVQSLGREHVDASNLLHSARIMCWFASNSRAYGWTLIHVQQIQGLSFRLQMKDYSRSIQSQHQRSLFLS